MGFQYWGEGLIFVGFFLVIIAVPCYLIAFFGSRMINDLGNFPSKTAEIQISAGWKFLIIELVAFLMLALFFHIFN
jgi:hypothetical protein